VLPRTVCFKDYIGAYKWLLEPSEYENKDALISELLKVVETANKWADEYREEK
jgi:hypothetical protein